MGVPGVADRADGRKPDPVAARRNQACGGEAAGLRAALNLPVVPLTMARGLPRDVTCGKPGRAVTATGPPPSAHQELATVAYIYRQLPGAFLAALDIQRRLVSAEIILDEQLRLRDQYSPRYM
ncbi:hypothetical protein Atai01_30340 [Amycolatopsis taiwanensis]|uniref:Uncharacterized protein n=1 Tax=Amycolatopsis taiwanensis TaxID=342230 RepID=A0A9W6R2N8_9PSEU|nr:hypothetical protein Atai01_30340 [Amycolatopsis taiwanensis]